MKKWLLIIYPSLFSLSLLAQPNCTQTSVGFIPINDLGTGTYNGWVGGLYPNGSNFMPLPHKNAGLALAAQVQPLDQNGNPDPVNGNIVWLSIGMSNTTMESSVFIPLADALPNKNPKLTLIDGALGGQTASIISTPSDPSYNSYWGTVSSRLANAGLTSNQVQVIWFKEDNSAGSTPVDEHADSLYEQTKRAMHEIKTRFPNVKLCYIASRIYGGYATTTLNPEPYAYRNGWTMKKVIEDQINGDPTLQYSGPGANSPWLSWGVYQWADGTTPRTDGLTWICPDDFNNDGTHPSQTGRLKVANILLNFFQNDSTSCPWFLNNCSITTGIQDSEKDLGIHIYPNPFMDDLTISLPYTHANVTITDVYGRQLRKISTTTENTNVSLSDLPSQIYLISILTNENIVTRRVIKQ